MSTNDIAIKISDIHVSFGNHHVLRGASGIIRRGSIVTFLGRNGCGKSTLLKTVTGNLKPQQGSIEIDGRPLSSYSSDEMARVVAFLPQFLDTKGDFWTQMLIFEATFITLAFANAMGYALIASRARAVVSNPRAIGLFNKAGGTLLIGAGVATVAIRSGSN